MTVRILHGDCREVMRGLDEASLDSIVTDPPYELGFMGKGWDSTGVANDPETWRQALRVLKPGGHLLAFGGTRTYHRMVCAIEDAGFEIRDQIGWAFGSGFPKSHNGPWGGTALKPAWEPICMARKPLIGTVAANVLAHGVGALNIDGCRIDGPGAAKWEKPRGGIWSTDATAKAELVQNEQGRWPANLIHDGSDEVLAEFPVVSSGSANVRRESGADRSGNTSATYGAESRPAGSPMVSYGDTGSAARFFASFQQEVPCRPSSAGTAPASSSLRNALADSVASAAAIWPSLAGIASSDWTALSMPVTVSESKTLHALAITVMAPIGSGFSHEARHEKHTPCGSLVSVAAMRVPTGTTTITASLLRSDGCAEHVTFDITPTPLDRGDQVFARLRYCAKADRADRNDGMQGLPTRVVSVWGGDEDDLTAGKKSTIPRGNHHPTVKPTDLMRYLCRLVTPPGGLVLDPFMGSGSTLKAAELEGFSAIGIEISAEYIAIARRRIAADAPLFAEVA